jgi:hypothetical protein
MKMKFLFPRARREGRMQGGASRPDLGRKLIFLKKVTYLTL